MNAALRDGAGPRHSVTSPAKAHSMCPGTGDVPIRRVRGSTPEVCQFRVDHDREVNGLVFSPDGSRIATASSSYLKPKGLARIFDVATGEKDIS